MKGLDYSKWDHIEVSLFYASLVSETRVATFSTFKSGTPSSPLPSLPFFPLFLSPLLPSAGSLKTSRRNPCSPFFSVSYSITQCLYIRPAVCIASVSLCIRPDLVWYFTYLSTCTELVLKIMDAGYCLYVHIFMKNIKSLKPFNFYNSNQLMPDLITI